VSWGGVPTHFASTTSSIGPILELFTFFRPTGPGPAPKALYKPYIGLISLISLIGLKSSKSGFEPTVLGRRVGGSSPGGRKNETAQTGSGPLGSPPVCVCPPKSG
jgi:hypothetical protein